MNRLVIAYLDAGSGSMLVQLLVGGFAGVAAFVKFRWHSIKSFFARGSDAERS